VSNRLWAIDGKPVGAGRAPALPPCHRWARMPGRLVLQRLRARGRLRAGARVQLGAGARVTVAPGARVELGDGVALGPGSRIDARGGVVRLAPGALLGERAVIVALAGVEVGAGAVVGDWAAVADAGPTWASAETAIRRQPLRVAPLRIGDGAHVGAHASVGASVADGAVVAPYAVVEREPQSSS
jgi:acetyltransferase-like isoleucine patch superfamily enzyme